MVEDTLNGAKSTRYKHAARRLLECASLAPGIQALVGFETHGSFVGRLRAKHGGKALASGVTSLEHGRRPALIRLRRRLMVSRQEPKIDIRNGI